MAKFSLTVTGKFSTTAERMWDILTNPVEIAKYLYGTTTRCDWKVGSPISFSGEWEGKKYEDRGTILECVPGRRLAYNYFSNFSGLPDLPENYQVIGFTILPTEGGVTLEITQEGMKSAEAKDHSEANWKSMTETINTIIDGE
jgi:uncharacterized protein YndB with AHSA1/START domain